MAISLGLQGAIIVIQNNNDSNYNQVSSGTCLNYITRLPG